MSIVKSLVFSKDFLIMEHSTGIELTQDYIYLYIRKYL